MKALSICLFTALSLLCTKVSAQTPVLSATGWPENINFTTCASIQNVDYSFSWLNSYENNTGSGQSFKYLIELIHNGNVIASKEYESGDSELACFVGCPPIAYTFEDVAPSSGYYYARLRVRRYFVGFLIETVFDGNTNLITLTRPDDGSYAVCGGREGDNAASFCQVNDTEVYQFVSGQYFVVQKNSGIVYKFANLGSSGDNMFGISTNPPANLPTYGNLLGNHDFAAAITDMIYTPDGKTLISFADGKVLKINGTGGTGNTMFAVNESATGFTNISPYTYYAGDHKFQSRVNDLMMKDGMLFVACENGNLLKVNGSGGGGSTMFAVTESASGFANISPYTYFSGTAHFNGAVRGLYSVGNEMFVATGNGKLLKISNTGGTGNNMFGIIETATAYSNAGYPYYLGDYTFQSQVVNMYSTGTQLFVCCANGKILKVNGTGGGGNNMFAITENASGFANIAPYTYYIGSSIYSSPVTSITQNPAATRLFIGFSNGKMMKILNTGSTGNNMFNATEVADGFVTSTPLYSTQLLGSSAFNSGVSDVKFFGSTQIICLYNNKMLKINGEGGTGKNMYAVAQLPSAFRPLLGYTQYLTGSQALQCNISFVRSEEIEEEPAIGEPEKALGFTVYPNPFTTELSIDLPEELRTQEIGIEIFDVTGKLIVKTTGEEAHKIATTDFKSGLYLVHVKSGDLIVQSVKAVKR